VKAVKHKKDDRIEGDSLSANEIDEAHTVWMNGMQRTLPEKGNLNTGRFSLIFIVTKKMYGDAKVDWERQTCH
jgi:hypothetical protein